MKILVAATAVAVAAAPAALGPIAPAKAQGYSSDQTTTTKAKKAKKAKKQKAVRRSPYSSNPDYDVYVNGVYVGSDPDPRIRWSLKREYCQDSVDGCGH